MGDSSKRAGQIWVTFIVVSVLVAALLLAHAVTPANLDEGGEAVFSWGEADKREIGGTRLDEFELGRQLGNTGQLLEDPEQLEQSETQEELVLSHAGYDAAPLPEIIVSTETAGSVKQAAAGQPADTELHTDPSAVSPNPAVTVIPLGLPKWEGQQKLVALTFDDGPDGKYTPAVLDMLAELEVKATFFVVGSQAEKYPEVLMRIHEEGHDLGNHTFLHSKLTALPEEQLRAEIQDGSESIAKLIGAPVTLFRAPYGAVSPEVLMAAAEAGQQPVGWTVDTRDWEGVSAEVILEKVKMQTKPGGVILMHSFGGAGGKLDNTLEALPEVVRFLREQGCTLVTVSELLAEADKNK